ncbi:MAG TPA: VWA domain-containing protein [Pyrinomonadaceae bacterium]|mgnify:CR=1 FL=1|nr:VWA domain-containing protein [Pyrinomonadaceae bacterium]HMP64575.1 VWA domain-containing protein [Pyrinomonadaceae bacterium]
MKLKFRIALLFVVGWSIVVGGETAAQVPTATPPEPADAVRTFEVRLPVTVTHRRDLVSGLQRGDFAVFEDGVQQEITFFSDEKTNPPVFVGVLMDTSASTVGKLGFSKEAARNFLYTVVQLRKDQAAFMTFDHEVVLHQDFTDRLDRLDRSVTGINRTGSHTSLYDAIWQFADEKLRNAPGRRVIVLITDGDDTFSRATLADAIDIAQRTETTIFGISTKAGFLGTVPGVQAGTVRNRADRDLERLCEATGGQAFYSGDMLELERSFKRISDELRTQYIITYRPANQEYDGRERKVEVRFTDPSRFRNHTIRTKTSYRAIRDSLR